MEQNNMGRFKFPSVNFNKTSFAGKAEKSDWVNWKWQVRKTITDIDTLKTIIPLSDKEEQGVRAALTRFRMSITPYYISLIDKNNPMCPIKLQAIPRMQESMKDLFDMEDPLREDIDSPLPGLIHRYPDRVLLLVTQICSMYCRHCTRRRLVGDVDRHSSSSDLELAYKYIREHEEIRDIIISGGDPLLFDDGKIDKILKSLSSLKHVEIIRIGTRTPVVLPMRITDNLCKIIAKYHPVYVNTHFNHPNEITMESARACERLNSYGIPVHNQSVLLKDINDCPHVMKRLVQELMKIRVQPYYIYQCDLSEGISHFRTPIARGIQIIESLRGHTSGMAIPTFVVDAPGGGGKIPLMPNYLISMSGEKVILRNYEGTLCSYNQPFAEGDYCGKHPECKDPRYKVHDGPALMLSDRGPITLETESQRLLRFKEAQGKLKEEKK